MLFANVLLQMESLYRSVLEVLGQLVASVADRTVRALMAVVAAVREVPVDRTFGVTAEPKGGGGRASEPRASASWANNLARLGQFRL